MKLHGVSQIIRMNEIVMSLSSKCWNVSFVIVYDVYYYAIPF